MYEMLSQFRSTGIMRIGVDELKSRLGLIDASTGKERYTVWTMFATKVLEVAKSELGQYTDIHFTYQAKRRGRKFTDLEFKIKYAAGLEQLLFKFGADKMINGIYKRLTEEFKLSPGQRLVLL